MPTKSQPKIKRSFQTAKGMRDILPEDQAYWEKIRKVIRNLTRTYGFKRIDTPILEDKDLFVKGIGAYTDIVEKEMYTLRTKGGEKLALRPEFTPAIMRAYLENGLSSLPHPVMLYSLGPIFRYERAQKGRYRQSYQANFEIIGENDPILDAKLIQLFFSISKEIGLKEIITQINSIGCSRCRPAYRRKVVSFYRSRKKQLCVDCQRRLQQNPLRLLDCKESKCMQIAAQAPQTIDYLCEDCNGHFKNVLEYLDELEIPYILNPYLVRGLDYYTKTVFEFWPEEEEGRQIALGGGGRYDNLIKLLGGKDTPSVGFAMGLDRMINLMKAREIKVASKNRPLIFLVQLGELSKKRSLGLFEELRRAGLETASSFSRDTIKSQLRIANKRQARLALILGQKEALDETIIIRDMVSGSQEVVPLAKVVKEVKKRLKNN
ncbi:MAG: histidine--tRNA ligase [Parcubacteria group bacterium]|jgi:histidyl-tRNA synthetase|nr:histidine--tRNA ligase [Parcubacteria group bacterium]|tara:strand:+ start:956 stop:2257 length:1302 start_codon:yes stop_codon:yes gene_type:complete